MSLKVERINNQFKREISQILANEVKDKNIKFVTVTAVETTNDFSLAKVFVTFLNGEKKDLIMKSLQKAKGFVRSQLSSKINLRKMPDLRFVYDQSIDEGFKIEKMIKNLK